MYGSANQDIAKPSGRNWRSLSPISHDYRIICISIQQRVDYDNKTVRFLLHLLPLPISSMSLPRTPSKVLLHLPHSVHLPAWFL